MTDPVRAALLRERDLLHALTEVNDAAIAAWNAKDDERLFQTEQYQQRVRELRAERDAAAPRLRQVKP